MAGFYRVLYGIKHHIKAWKMDKHGGCHFKDFTFFEGFNGSVGWFKGKTQQYPVFWPQHIMVEYFPSMFPATHGQRSANIGPKSDILWHLWPSAPDSSYCWCTPRCFKGGGHKHGNLTCSRLARLRGACWRVNLMAFEHVIHVYNVDRFSFDYAKLAFNLNIYWCSSAPPCISTNVGWCWQATNWEHSPY